MANWVMLKTAGEAGEAGDIKTGWVRLSTSAPLRLASCERRRPASTLAARAGKLTVGRPSTDVDILELRAQADASMPAYNNNVNYTIYSNF